MSSVGLTIITKQPDVSLAVLLAKAAPYFDEIYLQVNGSGIKDVAGLFAYEVDKAFPGVGNEELVKKTHVSKYKWTENFANARNALQRHVKTDYWMWYDTDDEVFGLENLRSLIQHMDQDKVDALYMPYEYAHNDQGECIVLQWRERLLRTAHPFKWLGAVHESAISEAQAMLDRTESIIIRHTKTAEEHHESSQRNHKILLREYEKDYRDPRTIHYVAMSFFNLGEYDKAIKLYREHIEKSGWDEDKYRSLFYIGQAYNLLKNHPKTLEAAAEGVSLIPSRPEAYILAATAEFEMGNWEKCLEWITNASTKKPPKDSMSAIDPTYYSYRAEFLAAMCYLNMGRIKEANLQLESVLQKSPNFPAALEVLPLFREVFNDEAAVDKIKWLVDYCRAYKGAPDKLFEALPSRLFTDVRLNKERNSVLKPKVWPNQSIVFFCGESAESWGADTLSKGMGGSEEAVVYLSRELARLGWQVTVFNDRDTTYIDEVDGEYYVLYQPWTLLNPNDEFNILISWRRPTLFSAYTFNAKLKLVDLHDAPVGHTHIPKQAVDQVDFFMFKSQWQRDLAEHIPDSKCVVAPNGIVPEQFEHKVKRNPLKVVYASTHDRGLEILLDLWPEVKKQVPEAELHTYYGWNTFDAMHKNNPTQMKWKWNMVRKMHKAGAKDHGRLSHEELAKEFAGSGVWAYPTMFPEIDCITATKAGASGMDVVTSGFAVLQTKQLHGFKFDGNDGIDPFDMTSPKYRQQYIDALVDALKHPLKDAKRQDIAKQYINAYAWNKIAKKWSDICESGLAPLPSENLVSSSRT